MSNVFPEYKFALDYVGGLVENRKLEINYDYYKTQVMIIG